MNYPATPQPRPSSKRARRGVAFRFDVLCLVLAIGAVIGAAIASHRPAPRALTTEPLPQARFVPAPALHAAPASVAGRAAMAAWRALDGAPARAESDAANALSALRDWAKEEPDAALAWARSRSDDLRVAAIIVVLEAAAKDPAMVVAYAQDLMRDDPAHAADFGTATVGALVRAGDFGVALDFARRGPAAERGSWLKTIFASWAERDPSFARDIATALGTQDVGGETFTAVIDNWAAVAPAQAAAYAMELPTGAARDSACKTSFSHWALQDPASLAQAVPTMTNASDRDAAAAAFVCATDAANRPTATALVWAEAIGDAALRERALVHVVQEWAQQDATAAKRYIETAARLTEQDRAALLGALQPPPPHSDT